MQEGQRTEMTYLIKISEVFFINPQDRPACMYYRHLLFRSKPALSPMEGLPERIDGRGLAVKYKVNGLSHLSLKLEKTSKYPRRLIQARRLVNLNRGYVALVLQISAWFIKKESRLTLYPCQGNYQEAGVLPWVNG